MLKIYIAALLSHLYYVLTRGEGLLINYWIRHRRSDLDHISHNSGSANESRASAQVEAKR